MRKSLVILGILNDSDLEWFIANGNVYRCQKGDVVIQEGAEREIGNNMYCCKKLFIGILVNIICVRILTFLLISSLHTLILLN